MWRWSMRRGTPSRGSSLCRSHRPFTGPLTMGCAGASRRCSRTSRRAASTWRTARSRAPTGWTGSCWCCPWRSTGRCQPACGMPSRTEPRLKKDCGDATPERCPQPDLPVHAGHAAPALLPAAPHRPATTLGYSVLHGNLMGDKDLDLETLYLLEELLADSAGTILLISHDRDFLDRIV